MEKTYEKTYAVEKAINCMNLGIDFDSWDNGESEEVIEYLEGLALPGFEKAIHLSRRMRQAIRKIYDEAPAE